jgi:hypothetical protein
LLNLGLILLIPMVPGRTRGGYLVVPLIIAGSGLGLLVSQLNNDTLAPDLGGARRRGRRRELGRRLVRALVRPGLRRRDHAGDAVPGLHPDGQSEHRPPSGGEASGGGRAEGRRGGDESNTRLQQQLAGQPRPPRTRSSASRPTRDRSPSRSPCSSPSSPGSSGSSTPSAWCGCRSRSRSAPSRGWTSADCAAVSADDPHAAWRGWRYPSAGGEAGAGSRPFRPEEVR